VIVSPTALVKISILGFCELPGKMSRVIGDDVEPFEVFPCRKLEPKGGEEKMDEILPDVVVDSLRTSLEIPMLGLDEVPSCVDETL